MEISTKKESLLTAKRIVELRKENGLTQRDLASKAHLSPSSICRWETGAIDTMKWSHIVFLAKLFGVNESWLLGLDVPKYKDGSKDEAEKQKLIELVEGLAPNQVKSVTKFIKEFVL